DISFCIDVRLPDGGGRNCPRGKNQPAGQSKSPLSGRVRLCALICPRRLPQYRREKQHQRGGPNMFVVHSFLLHIPFAEQFTNSRAQNEPASNKLNAVTPQAIPPD